MPCCMQRLPAVMLPVLDTLHISGEIQTAGFQCCQTVLLGARFCALETQSAEEWPSCGVQLPSSAEGLG